MLLASLTWAFPTPVQAKQKASRPEAIQITESNNEQFHKTLEPNQISSIRKLDNSSQSVVKKPASVSINRQPQRPYEGKVYSKEEVQALIIQYSQQYNINPEVPLCIARLESGFNQFSKNKSSSASGVFQYLSGTWRTTDEGKAGLSVFEADVNVKAAIKYMASRKSTQPWSVRSKCPNL